MNQNELIREFAVEALSSLWRMAHELDCGDLKTAQETIEAIEQRAWWFWSNCNAAESGVEPIVGHATGTRNASQLARYSKSPALDLGDPLMEGLRSCKRQFLNYKGANEGS